MTWTAIDKSANKIRCEIRSLIMLEILFGLCALSVLAYQFLGRFDFGFEVMSYRFFNITFSLLFIIYLIFKLLKAQQNILILVALFSLFHFIEGIFIHFWFKVVIHLMILIVVGYHYYRHKTFLLATRS